MCMINEMNNRILELEQENLTLKAANSEAFQSRVSPWMLACFGAEISADLIERNHRFLEEALELVQSCGCTASEAHQLVDYVFGRPVGDPQQETGGVMVTLAALCLANNLDMHDCGEIELARIWTKVEKIRAKQAAKPKHSPLPQSEESSSAEVRAHIIDQATRAARCQLISEIESMFDRHGKLTAEQVIDLLSVEKEVTA